MPSYTDIFRELNAHKIQYVVIGGLAVNFHGIPRMTYDIDILIDFSAANVAKFAKLMKSWGFRPKIPAAINDIADRAKRGNWIEQKNMKAFNLVNPAWTLSEIDVLIDTPVAYSAAKRRAKKIVVKNITVPVISIRDLITLKKASGRRQDADDIENLRKVHRGK